MQEWKKEGRTKRCGNNMYKLQPVLSRSICQAALYFITTARAEKYFKPTIVNNWQDSNMSLQSGGQVGKENLFPGQKGEHQYAWSKHPGITLGPSQAW